MKKISAELDRAICSLFSPPEIGYNAVGGRDRAPVESTSLCAESNLATSVDPLTRVGLLRRKLENWVELKGREIEEYVEGEETVRIRYEALATLMVLRDLGQYFPEVDTASRTQFDLHKSEL